jgi:hypothetical protein
LQAATLAPVVHEATASAWVERARAVSLRRLEDEVAAAEPSVRPAAIAFRAPPEVAALFLAMLARAGSLEVLLAHAITQPLPRAGGPDEPWNRTTLCAFHHHRGVHTGVVRITGRAPDALVFELAGERWRSGDVRVP